MTRQALSSRPALAAIAAGLALVSTPALSQDAAPSVAAPATQSDIIVPTAQPAPDPLPQVTLPQLNMPDASAPVAQAAPAAAMAPPLPSVTPPVRTVRNEPIAAPRAERPTPVQRADGAVTERRVAASAQPSERVSAPVVAAPVEDLLSAPTTSPSELRNGASPVVQAQAADTTVSAPDNTALWVMGAGGAALLLGVGSLAFLRRRVRREDGVLEDVAGTPAYAPSPVLPSVAVPSAVEVPGEETRVATAYTPASPGSWAPTTARTARAQGEFAGIEAMAAEQPSAANPFLTRKKRLRRAEFIHARGHAPQGPAMIEKLPEPTAPVAQPASQQVYSFSATSARPRGWKPATN